MIEQATRSFQKPLPWMSSDDLVIGEEEEKRRPPASHSSRQGLGNDEEIDIESQLPTPSSDRAPMASSSEPGASSEPGDSHPGANLHQGDALAAVLLAESSSNPGGNNFPVIINVHLPPSPIIEIPDGEPREAQSRSFPERPRDSWDYHAEDSFEIEKEVATSEIEQEVALPLPQQIIEEEQPHEQDHGAEAPPEISSQEEQHPNHHQEEQHQPFHHQKEQHRPDQQQEQQHPHHHHEVRVPTITRTKNEFRQKLHLSDLILPSAADEPLEPTEAAGGLHKPPVEGLEETSPNESLVGDLPLLTSRRKPPRPTLYRVKTRLQDPPPMTPAVADQMASLWSDAGTRSRRISAALPPVEDEGGGQQQARFGPVSSRRISMIRPPNVQEGDVHTLPKFGPGANRKMSTSGGEPAVAGAVPAAAPSPLGLFSPSRLGLLSSSRMGLFSKSKANLAPPPEEERDPLDDDSIPTYKKKKKKKQRIWLIAIQWMFLAALIIVLIFAVKFRVLKMVIWRDIALWQWLALAIVVVSGRLIAGWCVMILVALIERHYILKKRVLYFVYGLRHAVKNCIWLALVIGVWKLVFKNIQEEDKTNSTNIVTRVLYRSYPVSSPSVSLSLFP